jgi:aminoglycoside phosphotransferase (APT) family kinase protein
VQCIVSGTTITAVVDWESAWIGNPLVDLAVAVTYLEFYGRPDLADCLCRSNASRRPIPDSFSTTYRSVKVAQAIAILAVAAETRRTAWVRRASELMQLLIGSSRLGGSVRPRKKTRV